LQEKYCNPCGRWLELSAEYWNKNAARYDGFDSQCKECKRAYQAEYFQKNKEKATQKAREYCKTDKWKNYLKMYREENREYLNEKAKDWREKNKERYLEIARNYKKRNHEKIKKARIERESTPEHKEKVKKYYEENKEKSFGRVRKRRAIKKRTIALLTSEQWNQAVEYFNNQCAYCGAEKSLSQDHVIPLSLGGFHVISNVVPACLSCNLSKSNKGMVSWYCEQDFFDDRRLKKIERWIGFDRKTKKQQLSIL